MGPLESLLEAAVQCANLEEVARLQAAGGGDAALSVALAALAGEVLAATSAAELADLVADLAHPAVAGCVPDAAAALQARAAGTVHFRAGELEAAAAAYSSALRWIDEAADGAGAATLFCNRSICHAALNRHAAALADAECAAAADPASAKARHRAALAHERLGAPAAALREARAALARAPASAESAALVARLSVVPGAAAAGAADAADAGSPAALGANFVWHDVPAALRCEAEASADDDADAGFSTADAAALAAAASPLLTVVDAPGAGRALTAAAAAAAGADLLREAPFALALTKGRRRSHCAACARELPAHPFPCARCPAAAFCSPACREAERWHSPGGPECGVAYPALLPPDLLLALRVARDLGARCGAPAARLVASLESHLARLPPDAALHLAAAARVAAAAHAAAAARAAAPAPPLLAAAVLRALAQVRVNGVAVVPPECGGAEDRVALAIYPITATMNHSCRPTIALRFDGAELVARAAPRGLKAGEPLLHCYGPQAGEMARTQRRAALAQQYFFECRCVACAAAAPDAAEAAAVGLACACGGAAPAPTAAAAGLVSRYDLPAPAAGEGACSRCGARVGEADWNGKLLPALTRARELFDAGCELAGGVSGAFEARRLLEASLTLRVELLHRESQVLGATADAAAFACQVAGDAAAAAAHARTGLAVAEANYGARSLPAAHQRARLAALLQAEGGGAARREAAALLADAQAVLELHGHALDA
jgi:hypothetical protein